MKTIKFASLFLLVLFSLNVAAEYGLSNKKIIHVRLVNKLGYTCYNYPSNRCEYLKSSETSLPWAIAPEKKGIIQSNHAAVVPLIKQQYLGYSIDFGPIEGLSSELEVFPYTKPFKKYWVVRVKNGFLNVLTKRPRRVR